MKMFKIRRMAKKDVDEVARILNAHFPHVGMTGERMLDRVGTGSRFFVAEEGGEIAGFCELRVGRAALLRGIAVKTGVRGKGIGTALVKRAVLEAKKFGMSKIWARVEAENEMAVRFYEGLGFVVKDEIVGKAGVRLYLMRKGLEN